MRTVADEHTATRADAEQRLLELRAIREALWPDRDDPLVLSELSMIESQIGAAEKVLR